MNTTENIYLDLMGASNGFKPAWFMVGYKCDFAEKQEHYIEIAPVVDNVTQAYQPLSKDAILTIKDSFDIELNGQNQIRSGWVTPDIVYIDNKSRNSNFVYYEPAGRQLITVFNAVYSVFKPNMIFFVKNDNIKVFAYIGTSLPSPDTKLYHCPFSNVLSQGKICLGNAKSLLLRDSFNSEIQYWKDIYWKSAFTSLLGKVSKKCTAEKFLKAKSFKDEWLVNANLTLKQLIENG